MTVHMFRGFLGRGSMSLSDLETRIDEWLQNNTRWSEDTVTHELVERNTEPDGSGDTYYSVDVRFTQDDTKANLTQKFTDKLDNKVAWYRLGYHNCNHDGESDGGCSWDDKVEWTDTDVSIPAGVRDFSV